MEEPYRTYNEKARHIIESNKYMVVSTSDKSCAPWAAPVFFAHDRDYNFYFISAIDSRHAENILANKKVAIVIYDSDEPIDSYDEVQLVGDCEVVGPKAVEKALDVYCGKLFAQEGVKSKSRYDPSMYVEPAEFRVFMVKVREAYTTGEQRRVEVDLKETKERRDGSVR